MKLLLFLCISLASSDIPEHSVVRNVPPESDKDTPEAVWNFKSTIDCVLHYSGLIYNGYGCYCGLGGSGVPVDGIDECCMVHDNCYGDAVSSGLCGSMTIYITDYTWRCDNSTITCAHNAQGCPAALCQCDKKVVECWGQFPKPEKKEKCVKKTIAHTEH
ncbi:unnamed protein product [Caenorhabditis sp. 36 PRJEB53466]|nr:unnamed protein product [Caenorhabditis sp. 36 PRJEB53466]